MPAVSLRFCKLLFAPQTPGHRTEIQMGRKDWTCVRWGRGRGQKGQDRGCYSQVLSSALVRKEVALSEHGAVRILVLKTESSHRPGLRAVG